jgi:hypothetical protein
LRIPPAHPHIGSRNRTYTVRSAGWDEEVIPAVIIAPVESKIGVDELKAISRATCERSGRRPLDLDQIHNRQEFVSAVLTDRSMAI